MVGLAIYVALSRVRRFASLKSIGTNEKINAVIEQGPPDSIPAQFASYFAKKEKNTMLAAEEAMLKLGWVGKFQ